MFCGLEAYLYLSTASDIPLGFPDLEKGALPAVSISPMILLNITRSQAEKSFAFSFPDFSHLEFTLSLGNHATMGHDSDASPRHHNIKPLDAGQKYLSH